MARRVFRACVALAALACMVGSASAATTQLQDHSMAYVRDNPGQRMTMFYFADAPEAQGLVDELEHAARILRGLEPGSAPSPAGAASWAWVTVDCASDASKGDCTAAGFTKEGGKSAWLFTQTNTEGIQAYNGARTAAAMASAVRFKFLEANPADVLPFVDELALFDRIDASGGKPVFIKFWEAWCTHCKSLKHFFDQAATYFKDQIEFMEVECSKTDKFRAFCQKNEGFPTLILFDGEQKHRFSAHERSIASFQTFFLEKLPADKFVALDGQQRDSVGGAAVAGAGGEATTKAAAPAAVKAKPAAAPAAAAATPAATKATKKKATKIVAEKQSSKKAAVRRSRDEDEDEEDDDEEERRPRRRSSSAAARRRRRRALEEDEDEDSFDEDDEEDEAPRRRRGSRSSRRRRYDDEDDEDEDSDDDEDSFEEELRALKRRHAAKRKARAARRRAAAAAAAQEESGDKAAASKPAAGEGAAKKTKKSKKARVADKDEL